MPSRYCHYRPRLTTPSLYTLTDCPCAVCASHISSHLGARSLQLQTGSQVRVKWLYFTLMTSLRTDIYSVFFDQV